MIYVLSTLLGCSQTNCFSTKVSGIKSCTSPQTTTGNHLQLAGHRLIGNAGLWLSPVGLLLACHSEYRADNLVKMNIFYFLWTLCFLDRNLCLEGICEVCFNENILQRLLGIFLFFQMTCHCAHGGLFTSIFNPHSFTCPVQIVYRHVMEGITLSYFTNSFYLVRLHEINR